MPMLPLPIQSLHLYSGFSHFNAIFVAKSFMTELASQARTPSIEVTKGVKDACLASTASRYFFSFSFSPDRRTESTVQLVYDWASVSMTRISSKPQSGQPTILSQQGQLPR